MLSPWRKPIPLRRSWCLWEILCTIEAGAAAQFSVQLSADEEADFIAAVAGSWHSAQEALTAVDVREAEAWQATDRAAIAAAVEAGVGFEETNVAVTAKLREWLAATATAAVGRLRAADD